MRARLHIGVSLPFAMALGRAILAGVREYAIGQPRWRLEVSDIALPPPAGAPMGGMIGFLASENWIAAAGRCDAAVNVSNRLEVSPIPRVVSDDGAVGRMAAEHLLHHGFRRFAFAGSMETMFGRQRHEGFRAALARAGHECLALTSNVGVPRGGSSGLESRALSLP